MKKKIAFCVNLDTLSLGTGWSLPPLQDPTYRLVDQRLIRLFDERRIKIRIFAVGRDLESAENREFIAKWHRSGHEIGNHTFSHPLNLASLTRREIEIELEKTGSLVREITRKKPTEFNAPGWAVSKEIDKVLRKLRYRIDYSPFLSWWIYPLLMKQWWRLSEEEIADTVWRRRDLFYPFWPLRSSHPEKIPLPTVTWLKIPVWHTGWFVFGEKIFQWLLEEALKDNPKFYYLIHPADVIGAEDVPRSFSGKINFERLTASWSIKKEYLDRALKILNDNH